MITPPEPNQTFDLALVIVLLIVAFGSYAVGLARGIRRRPDSDAWTTGFRIGWQSRQRIAHRRHVNERPTP